MDARADGEELWVSTTPGLEEALRGELNELGMSPRAEEGGASVAGAKGAHRELNLRLRTASRVLLRLLGRRVSSPESLIRAFEGLDLRPYLAKGEAVRVDVHVHGARWARTDLLARAFAERTGHPILSTPKGEDAAQAAVQLRLVNQDFHVSIDTSGELLHRRGYRQETSMAPLRESLAAGMMRLLDYRSDEPFWDPMCGSGTLLIEAAWMSVRRAPGLGRSFAFERWPSFDARSFDAQKKTLAAQLLPRPASLLFGSDLHAGALGTARRNARRAEVLTHLSLERKDATAIAPAPGMAPGLLAANLPYGKRVGERDDLTVLYRRFFENLHKHFSGWRAGLLVPAGAGRWFGATPDLSLSLENGGLPVELLGFQFRARPVVEAR